jgi:hypothetical protein
VTVYDDEKCRVLHERLCVCAWCHVECCTSGCACVRGATKGVSESENDVM